MCGQHRWCSTGAFSTGFSEVHPLSAQAESDPPLLVFSNTFHRWVYRALLESDLAGYKECPKVNLGKINNQVNRAGIKIDRCQRAAPGTVHSVFEAGSAIWNWLAEQAVLVGQWAPGICLCQTPLCWCYKRMSPNSAFLWLLGVIPWNSPIRTICPASIYFILFIHSLILVVQPRALWSVDRTFYHKTIW